VYIRVDAEAGDSAISTITLRSTGNDTIHFDHIAFAPVPTVPALTWWAQVLFALVLAVVTVWILERQAEISKA
jgi:membrane protein implicated in regulation of membrane protease activity